MKRRFEEKNWFEINKRFEGRNCLERKEQIEVKRTCMKKKSAVMLCVIMMAMTACGREEIVNKENAEVIANVEVTALEEAEDAFLEGEVGENEEIVSKAMESGEKAAEVSGSVAYEKPEGSEDVEYEKTEVLEDVEREMSEGSGDKVMKDPKNEVSGTLVDESMGTLEEIQIAETETPDPTKEKDVKESGDTEEKINDSDPLEKETADKTEVTEIRNPIEDETSEVAESEGGAVVSSPSTEEDSVNDTTPTDAMEIPEYVSCIHNFQKNYWPAPPTCSSGASYSMVCTECGTVGEHGRDGTLPHNPVIIEEKHGNCISPSIIVTICSSCNFEISREGRLEEEHDWISGTYEEFNLETLEWETKTGTKCSRCGEMLR